MTKKRKAMLVGGLGVLTLVLAAAFDVRLRVMAYAMTSDKLTKPLRLVQISDLHSCAYGSGQRTLLEAVEAQKPDAIFFTGDIVDDRMPTEPAYAVFAALAEQYPCYYVTGNHEYRSGEADEICEKIAALGVTVLRGERTTVSWQGQSVTICGMDDPESGQDDVQLAALGQALRQETFSILLTHRPEAIANYLQYPFDLIFSGHAHGGQWRIPGLLNGLLAPNQGLFPAYAGGQYAFDDQTLVVSRGLARESTRIPRMFNRPELVVVEVLPTESAANP